MQDTFDLAFALLTVVANVAVLFFTWVALVAKTTDRAAAFRDRTWDQVAEVAIPLAALVGLTATLGSLYYSEIRNFIPCQLCWFQRIAMYPLPLILGIAAWRGDRQIRSYVIPMAAVGAAISVYHYQLEWFPSQGTIACSAEIPCTVVWIRELGFISIPFMALSGFLLIIWLTWIAGQRQEPALTDAPEEG